MHTILLLALACTDGGKTPSTTPAPTAGIAPEPAPAAQPTVDIGAPRAPVAWRALDQLATATIMLPERAAPENADGNFTLQETWGDGGPMGNFHVWTHPLPFQTDMPRPNYAPYGAQLMVGGRAVPYAGAPDGGGALKESWYIDRNRIKLVASSDPEQWTEPASLAVPELGALMKRRTPGTAGITPDAFLRTSWTQDGLTRDALYLPAPTKATFSVVVPAEGRLRFSPGMLPDPIQGVAKGDGAEVVVSVNGEEVFKVQLDPLNPAPDASVDLAKFAGQTVQLSLETRPGTSDVGDDVVLADCAIVGAGARPPRRVVVIGMDTTRWDTLSVNGYARPTSPDLDQWARQSVRFDNAWATAPRTRPSFRSAMTGQYPLDALNAPHLAELLKPLGFATGGVAANVHLVPRFGFSRGFEHWHYENGARADVETDRALAWLDAHKSEDAFLFVHYMDPHTFYDAPKAYKRFTGKRPSEVPAKFNRWQVYDLMKRRQLSEEGKAWIRDAYDEEVLYMQEHISRLLATIESLPGDTLVIVHSDHGEEFWDHKEYEHNHSLYTELTKTVLWIRPPEGWGGGDHVVDTQVGLIDILPTVLDFAGVPKEQWPASPGRSLRPFVDASQAAEKDARVAELDGRPLVLGHMMFDQERWGVIWDKKAYQIQTDNGKQWLYDLATDPRQTTDLAAKATDAEMDAARAALQKGSGWPVRQGWRVVVPGTSEVVTIRFASPIEAAGVMDPEVRRHMRTNLEWGEIPPKTLADVGTVQLDATRTTLTYTPGPNPADGKLYITCVDNTCPTGTVSVGGATSEIVNNAVKDRRLRVTMEYGWVVVPTVNEADAIAGAAESSEMDALKALGYVSDGPSGDGD